MRQIFFDTLVFVFSCFIFIEAASLVKDVEKGVKSFFLNFFVFW